MLLQVKQRHHVITRNSTSEKKIYPLVPLSAVWHTIFPLCRNRGQELLPEWLKLCAYQRSTYRFSVTVCKYKMLSPSIGTFNTHRSQRAWLLKNYFEKLLDYLSCHYHTIFQMSSPVKTFFFQLYNAIKTIQNSPHARSENWSLIGLALH
jgi:hypothetical protein